MVPHGYTYVVTREECDLLFELLDLDGNGMLTLSEVKLGMATLHKRGVPVRVNAVEFIKVLYFTATSLLARPTSNYIEPVLT